MAATLPPTPFPSFASAPGHPSRPRREGPLPPPAFRVLHGHQRPDQLFPPRPSSQHQGGRHGCSPHISSGLAVSPTQAHKTPCRPQPLGLQTPSAHGHTCRSATGHRPKRSLTPYTSQSHKWAPAGATTPAPTWPPRLPVPPRTPLEQVPGNVPAPTLSLRQNVSF